MPVTLPLEVYEALEKGLGKEDARAVVKSLEATISEAAEYKWATTKEELLDAIRREFVTKDVFEERINALKTELIAEMKQDKAELLGKIEATRIALDRKFTIMFVILFFTIIFLNQNALEFIFKVFGLIR